MCDSLEIEIHASNSNSQPPDWARTVQKTGRAKTLEQNERGRLFIT